MIRTKNLRSPSPRPGFSLAFISRLTHPLGLGTEISATSSLPWKPLITTYNHESPPPFFKKKTGKLADFYIGKEKGSCLPSLNLPRLKPVNWTIEFALTRLLRQCRIWAGSGNHYCFVSFRPSELTIEQRKQKANPILELSKGSCWIHYHQMFFLIQFIELAFVGYLLCVLVQEMV